MDGAHSRACTLAPHGTHARTRTAVKGVQHAYKQCAGRPTSAYGVYRRHLPDRTGPGDLERGDMPAASQAVAPTADLSRRSGDCDMEATRASTLATARRTQAPIRT